ncbi:MAG: response regulator transcription factor [Lachnospiraceae bacterium]|nr:response regulator transcription factor [Lachnospiraceae bacterium]
MLILKAAVCDDVPKELERISNALDSYAEAHPELSFETDRYQTADMLLSAAEKEKTYDIALLDICMPGISGTDAARELFIRNPDTGVIFLTTSSEYAVEAFALNAVHYLLKPFTQEQFDAALDRAVQRKAKEDFLSLDCVDGVYRVRISEIAFIESQRHYLQLYLITGKALKLRRTISSMWEEIAEYSEFVKIGVSYIVNLCSVRKFSGGSVEMEGGNKIPVPRRCEEAVRKAYMDFCRKEALK